MCDYPCQPPQSVSMSFVLHIPLKIGTERKKWDTHYTFLTRLYHTLLTLRTFEECGAGERFEEVAGFGHLQIHEFIFFCDISVREGPMMAPLDTLIKAPTWRRACPAAEKRRNDLFQSFQTIKEPISRLVEGRYYFSDGIRLCLLMEVQPTFAIQEASIEDDEQEEGRLEIQPGATVVVRSVVQIE